MGSQLVENKRKVVTKFPERQKLQDTFVTTTTTQPEFTENKFQENIEKEQSLLTFDPFKTKPTIETKLEYQFFPADSNHSKENFRLHLLNQPDIETESDPDVNEDADLSEHLSSALNFATVTWTQDPYREEEFIEEGKPVFDIDFSKNPNN